MLFIALRRLDTCSGMLWECVVTWCTCLGMRPSDAFELSSQFSEFSEENSLTFYVYMEIELQEVKNISIFNCLTIAWQWRAFNSFRKKHLLVHAGPGSACNYGGLLPSGSQLDQWWCVKNEMFICCKMLISDRMWLICQDRFKVFFQFVQFALHLISIFSIVTRFVFGYYFLKKKGICFCLFNISVNYMFPCVKRWGYISWIQLISLQHPSGCIV